MGNFTFKCPRAHASWVMLWGVPAAIIIIPFVSLAAAPLVACLYGIRAQDLCALFAMYVLTMLGITLGYHRSLAHRSVMLLPTPRLVFLSLGAMAAEGPPVFWVAHHRTHHGDADGARDPHSPKVTGPRMADAIGAFFHSHVGWLLGQGGKFNARLVRDVREDVVVQRVERLYVALVIAGLLAPALISLPFKPTVLGFCKSLYWAGVVRIGLCHQATWMVNSVCHTWGYRTFETQDGSRNNWIVAALTLGEGWHNNHHADPARAHHGISRGEIDPTFAAITTLERMGLVRDVRR